MAVEKPLYAGYPVMFDVRGDINRLADDVLVVGDTLFRLTKGVTYNTPNNINAQKSLFKNGDFIGLKLNSHGKVISVWLIRGK